MIHRAVVIARNVHIGLNAATAGSLRTKLGMVVTLLLLSGCESIHVPDPNVRYVAFGDSSTSGPSTRDYPDILRPLLNEAPETIANEGGSGETSEEGLLRLKSLIADEMFPNTKVLFYWEGGNDVSGFIKDNDPFLLDSPDDPDYSYADELTQRLAETQANIEAAVAAARNAGWSVYMATYFFLMEDFAGCDALPLDVVLPLQAHNANAYIARLNERIRTAAANQDAILVDVAAADNILRQDHANYHDCNHLSEQGNAIVANLFLQALVSTTSGQSQ